MAFDRLEPLSNSQGDSAKVRANFQALSDETWCWDNLCADGTITCWPKGDTVAQGNAFGHWEVTGGSGAQADRETSIVVSDGMCAKLTFGTSTTRIQQAILSDADFNPRLQGKYVSVCAQVYASALQAAHLFIYDGNDYSYSSYHAGDSAFALLTVRKQLHASASDRIVIGLENEKAGAAYLDEVCCVGSSIIPQIYIPSPMTEGGTLLWQLPGAIQAGTSKFFYAFQRPAIVSDCWAYAATAPSGGPLTIDLNQGASGSLFSTPLSIVSGANIGQAQPGGTYSRKCFHGIEGSTDTAYSRLLGDVDVVNGAQGAWVHIRVKQWRRPQAQWIGYESNY